MDEKCFMKLKTRKSIAKRFKVTKKNENILFRAPGQDHFNARERGEVVNKKRRDKIISGSYARVIKGAM